MSTNSIAREMNLNHFPTDCGDFVDLTKINEPPNDGFTNLADTILTDTELDEKHQALVRWEEATIGIRMPAMLMIMHGGTEDQPRFEKCTEFTGQELNSGEWRMQHVPKKNSL